MFESSLSFPPATLPPTADRLRSDVREFLKESHSLLGWTPRSNFMSTFSAEFSQSIGLKGWLGLTWPKKYGGKERSALERFVVTEELLSAGAPVAAHWVAERQSGPLLIRYGTEKQRMEIL